MSELLEKIKEETEALKKQQKSNLEEYTNEFRKLDKEYNSLLEKKKNIQAFIDEALSEEKSALKKSIQESENVLSGQKKVLADYEVLKSEWTEKSKELESSVEDFNSWRVKQEEEYKEKKKTLSKKIDEQEVINKSLRDKDEKADNIKAKLGEEKIKLNKRENDLDSREETIDKKQEKLDKSIEENSNLVNNNESVRLEIASKKSSNDGVLQEIQQENAKLIKLQEDIAFRERKIEKEKEGISERENDIKIGDAEIKKRMDQANALYEKWKTELAKGGIK